MGRYNKYKPDVKDLHYNPITGVFVWKNHYFKRLVGKRAGRLNRDGYRQISLNDKLYYEHRLAFLIMKGRWPLEDTDHINRIRSDNRWSNLREATREENNFNLSLNKNNKLGLKGVHKYKKAYIAQIRINGKLTKLGSFDSKDKAKAAYDEASKRHHREFYYNPNQK